MAKILVLGGSYLQHNFLSTGVDMGHHMIYVDRDPNCYSRKIRCADFHNIDFSDEDEILKLCIQEQIDSIISPANEYGNVIASRICDKLSLLYNSPEVVLNTVDKHYLRKKLKNSDISMAKHIKYSGNIKSIEDNLTLPVIVKPSNSSGGRGVSSVFAKDDLSSSIAMAKTFTRTGGEILIEELVEGKQFSIETISSKGEHCIVGITEEIVSGPPKFIERSHFMGPHIFHECFEKFNDFAQRLLKKIGIETGPCHIEVIVQNKEIFLIEVGSRSGGWRDLLIKYSGSSNYNELIIKSYLGNTIKQEEIIPPKNYATVGLLNTPKDLEKYLAAKIDNSLIDEFFYGRGPNVNPQDLLDSYGYFYAVGSENIYKYKLDKKV